MSEKTMTVSKVARNFSKVIRRAERQGATVVTRNGKAVARIVPAEPRAKTGRELAGIWPRLFHLTPNEAERFGADIELGRKSLPPQGSPWDK